MSILRIYIAAATLCALTNSAQAGWVGTYESTTTIGSFVHSENVIVSGMNVFGLHSFSDGTAFGSFEWTGTLSPTSSTTADLSGTGVIRNLGERPFSITSGGLYLDIATNRYTLYWGATDPVFGAIGGVSYLVNSVPEPSSILLSATLIACLLLATKLRPVVG